MDSSPLDVMSLPAGQGNPSLPLYKHCQLQGEEKRVILSRPSRRKSHTHAHTHKHIHTKTHSHKVQTHKNRYTDTHIHAGMQKCIYSNTLTSIR